MKYLISLTLVLLVSCQQPESAEGSLRKYVKYRFSSDQTRDGVLIWLSEPLLEQYQELTDEDFDRLTKMDNLRFKGMRILNSDCTDKSLCYLTYTIKYETFSNENKTFATEVKKIAEMKKTESRWKISNINNIKTFHDSKKEIDPLESP